MNLEKRPLGVLTYREMNLEKRPLGVLAYREMNLEKSPVRALAYREMNLEKRPLGVLTYRDEPREEFLMACTQGSIGPPSVLMALIEEIVTSIQDETEGVPIRTVKSFLTKIPSVVTGADIVQWLMKNLAIEDPAEAMHIGSLIAAQGYFFPISDHVLSLKDDGSFYRFQAPYFWPSNCWEPENTDYGKSIEMPGCVNTTEMDIRKCRRMRNPQRVKKSVYGLIDEGQSQSPVHTPSQIARKSTKADVEKESSQCPSLTIVCCVAFSLMSYTEQYQEYDPFVMSPEPSNPWTSDDLSFWDLEASKDPSQQRVRKWGFSLDEALKDPAGRDQFLKFLESEFSSENLQ
nr:regulator of G-protein signaling 6-like [Oncorhynchus nerka]